MNSTELLGLLAAGENARVAFHRDGAPPDRLARDLSALLNCRGGRILFGVECDGSLSGLARSREDFGEWVLGVAGRDLQPRVAPRLGFVELDGREVGVVEVPADGLDMPYKAKQEGLWVAFMRAGSASRAATRKQEGRLYQSAAVVCYGLDPVPGVGPERLDRNRLENYFGTALRQPMPVGSSREAWLRRLEDADFLKFSAGGAVATMPGWLAFGMEPRRGPRQAGIAAAAYLGWDKGLGPVAAEVLRGPLVPRFAEAPPGVAHSTWMRIFQHIFPTRVYGVAPRFDWISASSTAGSNCGAVQRTELSAASSAVMPPPVARASSRPARRGVTGATFGRQDLMLYNWDMGRAQTRGLADGQKNLCFV